MLGVSTLGCAGSAPSRGGPAVSDTYDASHCPSLKNLCKYVLKTYIQAGEHCPVEDAVSTMQLYMRFRSDWEAGLLFSD